MTYIYKPTTLQSYAVGCLVIFAVLLSISTTADAQYFGRNKVQYETFEFQMMKTEHFEIYYYPIEDTAVRDAARMLERWYTRLSKLFNHEFVKRKPVVLYADQTDFQQTNVTSGLIGEGTGGFTEALKIRVVVPFTGSYADNDHVLGHELVHAFQYDIALSGPGGRQMLGRLPLWLVEGMAEYFSIGREDPHTAMWLRDAALRNDLPTIDKLTSDARYFPYRYGQALMAYIGGKWGDDAVVRLYKGSAIGGNLDSAIQRVTGLSTDSLSNEWIASIRNAFEPRMTTRQHAKDVAKRILAEDIDASEMNVAPAISPDGRQVIFLSAIDLFDIDLYLADAHTGKVLDKLVSASTNSHFDAISFINSAGSWSPDGKRFAFVVSSQGNHQIAILNVATQDIERQFAIRGVSSITSPSWSPDGKTIAFSGLIGGLSDLYLLDVATGRAEKLTQDRYADMQPVWSPDGKTLAFVTDRAGTDFDKLVYQPMGIATINIATLGISVLPVFPHARNINPQYSPDGRSLYFVSNPDGFSDIYRYEFATSTTTRLTNLKTGVSGITSLSPTMSVATKSGRMMFSVFEGGNYNVYAIDSAETRSLPTGGIDSLAAVLPPQSAHGSGPIAAYLADPSGGLTNRTNYPVTEYDASLYLDDIRAQAVGGFSSEYGAGLGGGISAYFSDILGNRELFLGAQLNGTFKDFGGDAFYLNSRNRLNWGVGISHYPYLAYGMNVSPVTVDINGQTFNGTLTQQITQHIFVDEGYGLVAYPFSMTQRAEVSAGFTHIGFDLVADDYITVGNQIVQHSSRDLSTPDALNLINASFAVVGDNSYSAFTSPVAGGRYRVEVGGTAGTLAYGTLLADFRKYFFLNPLTFAMRAFHYGRYGPNADDPRLTPLYVGYDTYVRGYNAADFDPSECSGTEGCPEFDRLVGNKVAIANLEFRVPLFGTSQFGLINFPYLPTEISFFLDGGTAWSNDESPVLRFERRTTDRVPVFSTGISGRFNILGYLILELYYAYPFQRPDRGWTFGFHIAPGW